jgi:hypothetical protein
MLCDLHNGVAVLTRRKDKERHWSLRWLDARVFVWCAVLLGQLDFGETHRLYKLERAIRRNRRRFHLVLHNYGTANTGKMASCKEMRLGAIFFRGG